MELVIEARPYTDPDVVRLVAEVQAVYTHMYGEPDSAAVDVSELAPPNGELLLGLADGAAVTMGGWRRLPDGGAEIKRMYTVPAVQCLGFGRRMLAAVEASAAAAGITRVVLNTGPNQHAAIAMYEAAGYRPNEPFGHYASYGDALFYAKALPVTTQP